MGSLQPNTPDICLWYTQLYSHHMYNMYSTARETERERDDGEKRRGCEKQRGRERAPKQPTKRMTERTYTHSAFEHQNISFRIAKKNKCRATQKPNTISNETSEFSCEATMSMAMSQPTNMTRVSTAPNIIFHALSPSLLLTEKHTHTLYLCVSVAGHPTGFIQALEMTNWQIVIFSWYFKKIIAMKVYCYQLSTKQFKQ